MSREVIVPVLTLSDGGVGDGGVGVGGGGINASLTESSSSSSLVGAVGCGAVGCGAVGCGAGGCGAGGFGGLGATPVGNEVPSAIFSWTSGSLGGAGEGALLSAVPKTSNLCTFLVHSPLIVWNIVFPSRATL